MGALDFHSLQKKSVLQQNDPTSVGLAFGRGLATPQKAL